MKQRVVVAFADNSLGGVCRSALSAGRMWESLGYNVDFLAFLPIHPGRADRFRDIGHVFARPRDIRWAEIDLVHLHHGAASPGTLRAVNELIAGVPPEHTPPLMTKNVFAVDDTFLKDWKSPRATTVPGRWTTMQYAYNIGRSLGRARTWIIPNVQDTEFFRPPTAEERTAARQRLGLDASAHYILRIGSPIMDKWSRSYAHLAASLRDTDRLLLVGLPKNLESALRPFERVDVRGTTSSDEELRDFYWSADKFALDARRGETFGNVAFEAMLCGLPVVYRARPYRDNTLWELRSHRSFSYAPSRRQWVRSALEPQERVAPGERAVLAHAYGYASVRTAYRDVATALTNATRDRIFPGTEPWQRGVGFRNKLRVMAWHNPLVSVAKRARLAARQ